MEIATPGIRQHSTQDIPKLAGSRFLRENLVKGTGKVCSIGRNRLGMATYGSYMIKAPLALASVGKKSMNRGKDGDKTQCTDG